MKKLAVIALAITVAATSQASFTMATFADPSQVKTQYLFLWDEVANTLSGGWHDAGLTLKTPGLIGGGQVANCQMDFDTVALSPIIAGQLYLMSAGRIRFHTGDLSNPLFEITFDSGLFQTPVSVGGSNFIGNNVKFSGTNIPTGLMDEQFSFALANEDRLANGKRTFTSSFTSSAAPEPVSLIAIAGGIAAMVRRRKSRVN